MTKHEFMHSTPYVLKAYDQAFNKKIEMIDMLAWRFCGSYVLSACSVAVEHCLAGNKARSKYIEQPVLKTASEEMSEERKQKERELFVARLEVMKTNFEMNHKNK